MTWSAGLCSASAPGDAAYTSRYKQMGSGIYKKCSRQTDVQCGWMEPLKAPFPLSLLFVLQVFVNVLVAQWSLATGANFAEDPWILRGKQEVDCPDPPPPVWCGGYACPQVHRLTTGPDRASAGLPGGQSPLSRTQSGPTVQFPCSRPVPRRWLGIQQTPSSPSAHAAG